MFVTYYLEQWSGLQDTRYQALNDLDANNQQAIVEYEEARVIHNSTPGIPYQKPSSIKWDDPEREMPDDDMGVFGTMPGVNPWDVRARFPGCTSVNRDDGTVNVLITKQQYVTNKPQKMKIGKYLTKLNELTSFTHLTADEINVLANTFKSNILLMESCTLEMAVTTEEVVYVYENGPNSCMSGKTCFEGHVTPAHVYGEDCNGDGDVHCAYVKLGDKIVARTLINKTDNTYICTYGNDALILPLLAKAGITSGDLNDCAIHKIVNQGRSNGYIMPYIDGYDEVGDHEEEGMEDFFMIGNYGDVWCQNTSGISGNGHSCEHCGEGMSEDEVYWIEDAGEFCSNECAEEAGYRQPHDDEYEWHHKNDLCELADGRWQLSMDNLVDVNDEWYEEDDEALVFCEEQDEHYLRTDCTYIQHRDIWVLTEEVAEYDQEYIT